MFQSVEAVLCHADDVLVYGWNRQGHDQRLHCVLKKKQDEGLILNEKCELAKESIIFVGHKICAKGIEPDPNKVKPILQMPETTCGGRELSGEVCATAGYCHHATEIPAEREKTNGSGENLNSLLFKS